jgi:hypothetical protein
VLKSRVRIRTKIVRIRNNGIKEMHIAAPVSRLSIFSSECNLDIDSDFFSKVNEGVIVYWGYFLYTGIYKNPFLLDNYLLWHKSNKSKDNFYPQ